MATRRTRQRDSSSSSASSATEGSSRSPSPPPSRKRARNHKRSTVPPYRSRKRNVTYASSEEESRMDNPERTRKELKSSREKRKSSITFPTGSNILPTPDNGSAHALKEIEDLFPGCSTEKIAALLMSILQVQARASNNVFGPSAPMSNVLPLTYYCGSGFEEVEGIVRVPEEDEDDEDSDEEFLQLGNHICDELMAAYDSLSMKTVACVGAELDKIMRKNIEPSLDVFNGERIGQQADLWLQSEIATRQVIQNHIAEAQNQASAIHEQVSIELAKIATAQAEKVSIVKTARQKFEAMLIKQDEYLEEIRADVNRAELKYIKEINKLPNREALKRLNQQTAMRFYDQSVL